MTIFSPVFATHPRARDFLSIFEKTIGSRFSLRDVCSYYNGLPYTFDLAPEEWRWLRRVFHSSITALWNEDVFLDRCRHLITHMDPNRCKFHYSELAIIFLGNHGNRLIRSGWKISSKHVIDAFGLTESLFSRVRPAACVYRGLSKEYDYPSIAILDHGYFVIAMDFLPHYMIRKNYWIQCSKHPCLTDDQPGESERAASASYVNEWP